MTEQTHQISQLAFTQEKQALWSEGRKESINSNTNFTIALTVYLPKGSATTPLSCDPLDNSGGKEC